MTDVAGPRAVIDTNVLISAALNAGGLPMRVVSHVVGSGALLVSDATLQELTSRLARPKFDRYLTADERSRFVEFARARAERVRVTASVSDSDDPDNNALLALALDGRADAFVTGDKRHLLPLHPWRGIPVVTPREFAERTGLARSGA